MKPTIIQADVLEWLKAYEGPRFQSVFCDPPYALISISERFGGEDSAPAKPGTDGAFQRVSGGFMGQKWDGFDDLPSYQCWVTSWAKLLIEKAVHPGAIGLFYGGTRTSHRLACGLEDAGWIIRDELQMFYCYGSGFPKALNVQKKVEKDLEDELKFSSPILRTASRRGRRRSEVNPQNTHEKDVAELGTFQSVRGRDRRTRE